jgi:hypothetical protein
MKSSWFLGAATDEEKQKRRQIVLGSTDLMQLLEELLKRKLESKHQAALLKTDYDSPSWALLQADSVGERRALAEIIDMLQIT